MEALIGVGINLLIGAALWGLGMLLRRPKHMEGPKLQNLQTQISSYGVPKRILYGQCKPGMELIYADKLTQHSHTQNVGKGGGDSVTTYTYSCIWAGLFGQAPDPAIFGEMQLLKLYADDKLVYNAMADADKVVAANDFKRFKFYSGSTTQLPDTTLEGKLGAGNVPAYRGKCYGVWNAVNVTPYGNRIFTTRAVVGPGTVATPGKYDVEGFNSPDGGFGYRIGMVAHPDGIHLITGYANYGATPDYVWQRVNTYTRKVVAEKIYYAPEPSCSGVGTCGTPSNCSPFGNYNSFDLDENGNIYAVSCEEQGPMVKLDSWTFAVLATGADAGAGTFLVNRVLVSKNPLYPYLWAKKDTVSSADDGMFLISRDTLGNPYDASDFGLFFGAPLPAASWSIAHAINHSDGSSYVLWTASEGHYLSRLYPDGRREDHDIGGDLPTDTVCALMTYDSETDQLIFPCLTLAGKRELFFFDASTYTLNGTTTGVNVQCASESTEMCFQNGVKNNHFYVTDFTSGNILKINVSTRAVIDEWNSFSTDFIGGLIYLPYKSSIFVEVDDENHYLQELTIGRLTAGTALLSDVVTDICQRAGLEASELNVAQLTDQVRGYALDEDQTAREALEPLMEAFIFDGVEIDGVLEFIKRGGASITDISEDDLCAHIADSELPEPLEIEYIDETELPKRVEWNYPDYDRKHEPGIQHYERQVTDSKMRTSISSPVLMTHDDAKQLAHIKLKYDWIARPCSLSLGPQYAELMPTDVVTVQKSENDYRILLLEAQREGLLTNWTGVLDNIDYSSIALGVPGPVPDDTVAFVGPSLYQLMDLPPLLGSHNQPGVYMASGAMFADWHGCNVYVSKGEWGESWIWLKNIPYRATTGVSLAALGDFGFNRIDNANSLTVRWDMDGDALSDKTTAEWWNGQAHYLLVGEEIICAKDVTTNGDGSQTLGPPLIRGCQGTEYAKTDHVSGERVIVLNMSTTVFAALDTTYLNQSYIYNGVSVGDDWEDGSQKMFTTELRTLKPWAGVQAEGSRDGSNNLIITWRRRDRFGGLNPLRAGTEVPMSEDTEAYEIDIYDAGVIVRTITGLSNESASYTAAEQTADGLTPGDPVDCGIYQLSATTGRGWELAATV